MYISRCDDRCLFCRWMRREKWQRQREIVVVVWFFLAAFPDIFIIRFTFSSTAKNSLVRISLLFLSEYVCLCTDDLHVWHTVLKSLSVWCSIHVPPLVRDLIGSPSVKKDPFFRSLEGIVFDIIYILSSNQVCLVGGEGLASKSAQLSCLIIEELVDLLSCFVSAGITHASSFFLHG